MTCNKIVGGEVMKSYTAVTLICVIMAKVDLILITFVSLNTW